MLLVVMDALNNILLVRKLVFERTFYPIRTELIDTIFIIFRRITSFCQLAGIFLCFCESELEFSKTLKRSLNFLARNHAAHWLLRFLFDQKVTMDTRFDMALPRLFYTFSPLGTSVSVGWLWAGISLPSL